MAESLDQDSTVHCEVHGESKPTFVCQHLKNGAGLGFNTPDTSPEDDDFKQAWCDSCDQVLMREGGWNDTSEAFASPIMMCDGCFETIRERNKK